MEEEIATWRGSKSWQWFLFPDNLCTLHSTLYSYRNEDCNRSYSFVVKHWHSVKISYLRETMLSEGKSVTKLTLDPGLGHKLGKQPQLSPRQGGSRWIHTDDRASIRAFAQALIIPRGSTIRRWSQDFQSLVYPHLLPVIQLNANLGAAMKGFYRYNSSPKSVDLKIGRLSW